ncbi:MAG: TRAP transporter substrate-binding protein DctP [Roseibium album]|uniref:Neu5Ac-binding protein n=1 Tax=Roseibium album TaxID=311410 RepID=A0A0M7AHB9_9HYPH|nr:TRAP transporter substrate-binding protein DctP [Roseibium album]MBG6145237.1 tripartite ATP-independent transporter DctP family solute receptor [Labrenzia sp. EL_142]MBG6155192.1 tripartite ATP-independent transporter DctP family solute receptor [Labrenzia sp. EL_162]MBG6162451.1 tripartite ATP-independent transporter DctP family solute receptor [Labrenzia sp. EL_195]MBG6173828.1 tripartite ATP-independent transporter DctP family solute receptor [Labrenzia sp. EL_132]MBG6192678.1 tripartit
MKSSFVLNSLAALTALAIATSAVADDKVTLRMSTPASETDQRSVALAEVFAPEVAEFATYEPHYNASLIKQNSELEAIASGDLEMSIASAQELAQYFPEFSIFATGYVHQDADHQVRVFNDPLMDPFKQKVEDELGVKLLAVMYLGRRHVNLRQTKDELTVKTPADLAGVNLRMPGTDAWQFLGKALGANPTPMAFTEVYTALQTGSVDGQDNPLPTVVDAKFFEVTNQIALTSHLVDLNYVAFSKAVWDELTPEQQAKVKAAAEAAAESGRNAQLQKEAELVSFLEEKGLAIYEPDLNAFRDHVQSQYVGSEFAASWPDGVLDKINALGN